MRMLPACRGIAPRSARSRVVLPAPDGPTMPTNAPGRMANVTSSRTGAPSYAQRSRSISIAGEASATAMRVAERGLGPAKIGSYEDLRDHAREIIRVGGAAPPAASRCCARASLRAPSRGDPPLEDALRAIRL